MDNELKSPIIIKYQNLYKEDPNSRVFAPLAEAYRKFGMIDDAIEILKKGIRIHPDFVLAYLGLSFCYFEKKEFNIAFEILRPLIDSNRENLRLQKLYSKCCIELGKYEEALDTLKYLLFMNPRDAEVAQDIKDIEASFFKDQAIEEEFIPSSKAPSEKFSVEAIDAVSSVDDIDNWVRVDLPKAEKEEEKEESSGWEMKKAQEVIEEEPVEEVVIKFDIKTEKDSHPNEKPKTINSPVSHTLVDLYLEQGYHERAIEILEKIVELNPTDERSSDRLQELRFSTEEKVAVAVEVETADDALLDKKIDLLMRFQNAIMTRKSEKFPY